MAGEPLKFRCYQCNKLLGSSPGKAGSVVSCPRCGAELVVPTPEAAVPVEPESGIIGKPSPRATATLSPPRPAASSYLEELAAGIPADLADLRPEDLRVEADVFNTVNREPARPREPDPFPVVVHETPRSSSMPETQPVSPVVPAPAPYVDPRPPAETPWVAAPGPAAVSAPYPDVPPIKIEPPSILPGDRPARTAHDVVLPASVVLAWSLFGLIGIAASFLAGLMIGHYFWRM